MANIFTYGSLMFQPVWSRVVGGDYRVMRGTVYGVRRKCVKGETYPCLIMTGSDHDRVDGLVYFDVGPDDCRRLDQFEGEYYYRALVMCELADKRVVDAHTYLFRKEFEYLVENNNWDAGGFEAGGIYSFLKGYKGFSSV